MSDSPNKSSLLCRRSSPYPQRVVDLKFVSLFKCFKRCLALFSLFATLTTLILGPVVLKFTITEAKVMSLLFHFTAKANFGVPPSILLHSMNLKMNEPDLRGRLASQLSQINPSVFL